MSQSVSVLVVEDEKHLAAGLQYNLKAEGYEVETVGTAEEALALLNERRKWFDVVVLDVSDQLVITDCFVIASGTSDTHVRGVADHVIRHNRQAKRVLGEG